MRPTSFTRHALAALALAGALLAIVGCGTTTGAGSGAGNGGGAGPANLTASAIVARAQSAALKDASGSEAITSKSSVTSITINGAFKLTTNPSRYAFDGASTSVVNGKSYQNTLSAVYTDTDIYSKVNGGWDKTSMGNTSSALNFDPLKTLAKLSQPQLVGVESVNGVSAYHLKGVLPAPTTTPGSQLTVSSTTVDMWLRQDNFYPVKALYHLTSTYPSAITNQQETTTTDVSQSFTKWDSGISIALPQV